MFKVLRKRFGPAAGGRRRLPASISPAAAGALAAALFWAIWTFNPFGLPETARERAFDAYYEAFPRQRQTARVVVVDIDEATLASLGDWPAPRSFLARLVETLSRAKASAIGFDIFFAGADRRSSQALAKEVGRLPGGETLAPAIAGLPDSDSAFAEALGKAPTVLGALAAAGPEPPPLNAVSIDGPLGRDLVAPADGFTGPYPPFAEAALSLGALSLSGEAGGLVRRAPLLLAAEETVAPGLAIEAARIASGAPLLKVEARRGLIFFGERSASLVDRGTLRLYWSDPSTWPSRTLSALDAASGAGRLAGAAVLIGSSAPQAGALRPTALGPLTPTVQIQAEALEQLLDGQAPARPPRLILFESAVILLFGLTGALFASMRGPVLAGVGLAGLFAASLALGLGFFWSARLLFDPVGPALAAMAASLAAASASFAKTRRLKALISRRFEQYLAPEVVREIIANPDRLKREGELREVTALFTDIEGFTSLAQRIEPTTLIRLLDRYFDGLCRIVTDHGGMVDGIVGDAVHGLFNVPFERPSHVDDAIDCAVAIADFARGFCKAEEAAAVRFGRTRIGVETGPAIVGDVGGARRLNYTAHGSVMSAAARLEVANKDFRSTICIGPRAAAASRRRRLSPLGRIHLRGFAEDCEVFTADERAPTGPRPAPPEPAPRPTA